MRPFRVLPSLALAAAVATGAGVAAPAAAGGGRAAAAPKKSVAATFSYVDTSTASGPRAGHGRFSGKLSGHAAALVRAFAQAAGVPYASLLKGGVYAVRFEVTSKGDTVGLFAARLKASKLGTACATYTETHGQYVSGFVPTSGTFRTVGGTGMLARVHVTGRFAVTGIAGDTTEVFSAKASIRASLGKAQRPTPACRTLLGKLR